MVKMVRNAGLRHAVGACFLLCSTLQILAVTLIDRITYHSWPQSFRMSNGTVEAIIVPAIGRVMQLRFNGEEEGPFWENRGLDAKSPNSQSSEWINFGGDKTWPAPQGDWEKTAGRGWPPPSAFDSMPLEVEVDGDTVVLRSPVDRAYGIRTVRRIRLLENAARMEIETRYEKVEGTPKRVAIWVITQLQDPEKAYIPMAAQSRFPNFYNKQSDRVPADLHIEGGWLSCTRSPQYSSKIGTDADSMIWGNSRWVLRILTQRESDGEFPDDGSSAEIYTNPDPARYVELETLGPLHTLKKGDHISRKQTYELYRRDERPLQEQVKAIARRK